jgi:hypothetical protein
MKFKEQNLVNVKKNNEFYKLSDENLLRLAKKQKETLDVELAGRFQNSSFFLGLAFIFLILGAWIANSIANQHSVMVWVCSFFTLFSLSLLISMSVEIKNKEKAKKLFKSSFNLSG